MLAAVVAVEGLSGAEKLEAEGVAAPSFWWNRIVYELRLSVATGQSPSLCAMALQSTFANGPSRSARLPQREKHERSTVMLAGLEALERACVR